MNPFFICFFQKRKTQHARSRINSGVQMVNVSHPGLFVIEYLIAVTNLMNLPIAMWMSVQKWKYINVITNVSIPQLVITANVIKDTSKYLIYITLFKNDLL